MATGALLTLVAPGATGATGALGAQSGEITWPRVAVEARLDSLGRLHVREVQAIRFTGDWNGGERTFDLGRLHTFQMHRMSRVDSATGTLVAMHEGDLDVVDGYRFSGNSLRWRARLPDDPPFDGALRTYQLEYVYGGVIRPVDGDSTRYVLDHDFGFSDRIGNIDRFTLYLTFDPAWEVPPGFEPRRAGESIPPGAGFVVEVPLRWTRPGRPEAVSVGAAKPVRYALALLVLLPFLPLALRVVAREQALGRFAPLMPPEQVDHRWVDSNVMRIKPEVVGAAWDDTTGQAEVAATLARLVQERKLGSRVEKKGKGIFSRDILHLDLNVPRGQLDGHERALIDGLFVSGDHTDTDRVRKHYKSTGFDPAALIRKPLAILVDHAPGAGTTLPKPSRWPSLVLLLAGIVTFITALLVRPQDSAIAFVAFAAMTVTYIFCIILAALWQRRVRALLVSALLFVLPMAAVTAALAVHILTNPLGAGAITLGALALIWLAYTNSIANQSMARQSAERVALRKRLAAAREFFRRELKREQPALRDEWFPYLIAFGLGRHIDKWFRAFGGENARGGAALAGASSSSGSSSGGSWTGFGGGGGFSGGGSSASFAAAVGGMASSVPSPSSGGSSGGGGGGGSSGGGGGGGW